MIYFIYAKNWSFLAELLVVLVCLSVRASGDAVCLSCSNLPHPRDCNRVVQCNSHEMCYVEQLITTSGNVLYNSGCASMQRCSLASAKRSVSYSRDVNEQINSFDKTTPKVEHSVGEPNYNESSEDDVIACFQCCNETNYCNRYTCDSGSSVPHPNQTYCLSCSDVVTPSGCEYLVLCNPGEICYTEFMNLNGEDRYRLGCIAPTACAKSQASNPGPSLVGRKRSQADSNPLPVMDNYCSKCCSDTVGNCNRELCDSSGTMPPGTEVYELVNPPERHDFCMDLYPTSCKLLILETPALCLDKSYSHYACREKCGTCVNPGHVTSKPSTVKPPSKAPATTVNSDTTSVATTTMVTTPMMSPSDCFYESTRYLGGATNTVSGKPCLKWSEVNSKMTNFPDGNSTLAENKCRDPDGRGFPWCYTDTNLDWEFCRVPYCQECYYRNNSTHYAGYITKDMDNNTCLPWTDYFQQAGISIMNIEKLKNYCRDPLGTGTPQCYNGKVLKNCDVPICPHSCEDKPETNCGLVKKYVCRSEFTSVTLCPVTCASCHFGLLPPKQVDPPVDACQDNPDASCDSIKFVICADKAGAIDLCPKTCGLCSEFYARTTLFPATSTPVSTIPPYPSPSHITDLVPTIKTTIPSPSTVVTTTLKTTHTQFTTSQTPTVTTTPSVFWLPWGQWTCEAQTNGCFQRRSRGCSTGNDKDCADKYGSHTYDIALCDKSVCPNFLTSTTIKTTTVATTVVTPTTSSCQDDNTAMGCNDPEILKAVCADTPAAWSFCPRSCGLCDTCWDFLNCSSPSAQKLFCGRDKFALQYCRQTCNKCDHKPVPVQINKCNDPVASEMICETLHQEICICKDSSISSLCQNYCNNQCTDYPFQDIQCQPSKRRKRDAVLSRVLSEFS